MKNIFSIFAPSNQSIMTKKNRQNGQKRTKLFAVCGILVFVALCMASCNHQPKEKEGEITENKAWFAAEGLLDKELPPCDWAYISPDGSHVLYKTTFDTPLQEGCIGNVYVYDTKTRESKHVSSGGWLTCAAYSPKGDKIATFSNLSSRVDICDAKTCDDLCGFDIGWSVFPSPYVFSPDGEKVVFYANDTARIWDVASERELCVLDGSSDKVEGMVLDPYFSPDGKQIVASLGDRIMVWNSEDGKIIRSFEAMSFLPSFSPDGKRIVYASITSLDEDFQTNRIRIIDAVTGETALDIDLPEVTFACVVYSPNGKWIAVSCIEEGKILVYDAETGEFVMDIESERFVNTLSFSPDDRQMIYVSNDSVYVCNVRPTH